MGIYINLGDIKGESNDATHKGWIEVDSLSHPISRNIQTGGSGTKRSKGTTTFGDIDVTKHVDKASPKIAEAVATGKFLGSVEVNMCNTFQGKQVCYMKFLLKNVVISKYQMDAKGGDEKPPLETFSLNFSAIEWNYNVLDPEDGTPQGMVPGKYSLETGEN